MNFIKNLYHDKTTVLLTVAIIVLTSVGIFLYKNLPAKSESVTAAEVDLPFDPEGPYALLYPRRDGNALVLNIKRTASYEGISYELSYSSEGIDRGVMGTIDTKEKKGEYEQEILFGTCSKNVCKYDKDVENGTLTLHIKNKQAAFRMVTQWHLQKPDIALGALASGDGHLTFKIDSNSSDLTLIKYSIINDLSGAPKLPADKTVLGKVYGMNAPVAKILPAGSVSIELAENPPAESKIARFDEVKNAWIEYETKINGGTLAASADAGGIFTVLTPKK